MKEQIPSKITRDQAWLHMRQILDAEMPVEKEDKKPFVAWWMLGMAAVILVASFLIWSQGSVSDRRPSNGQTQQEAAMLSDEQLKKIDAEKSTSDHTILNNNPSPIEGIQHPPVGNSKINENKTNSSTVQDPIAPGNGLIPTRQILENEKPAIKKEKDQLFAGEHVKTNMDTQIEGKADPETGNESVAGIVVQGLDNNIADTGYEYQHHPASQNHWVSSSMSLLPILPFEVQRNDVQITVSPEVIPFSQADKFHMKVHPVIGVSSLVGFENGLGLAVQAGAELSVSRKLTIQAGVGYREYDPSFSFGSSNDLAQIVGADSGSIIEEGAYVPGYSNYIFESSLNSYTAYEAILPIIDRMTQWTGHAGVTYDLTKHWFLTGGVQVGFKTKSYSTYPILQFDYLGQPSELKTTNSLTQYKVLRNTMTSGLLGVGYHAGKHLDIQIGLEHGFQSYILNEENKASLDEEAVERTDFMRGLTLGIKYRI